MTRTYLNSRPECGVETVLSNLLYATHCKMQSHKRPWRLYYTPVRLVSVPLQIFIEPPLSKFPLLCAYGQPVP